VCERRRSAELGRLPARSSGRDEDRRGRRRVRHRRRWLDRRSDRHVVVDPAFAAPAVAAVKRLACNRRQAAQRYALPMSFSKPEALSESEALAAGMHDPLISTRFLFQKTDR